MDVGILQIFQNYQGRGKDADMVRGEMHLAQLAEGLGYDKLWAVEHHFTDYAACPDNLQYLSWLAGRTSRIQLATGAVIVPWNDPLRVAEKVAMLDHLSGGRAVLGLGRGLARSEYGGFGIDMGESRRRFDEASRMIIEALETGRIQGDGPFYPQAEIDIRPRPLAGFRDRFYCVGMSPDSVEQAAALGAKLMIFSQQTWDSFASGSLADYRESYGRHHDREAPIPLTGDLMFCHEDPERAEELAMTWMPNYFLTIVQHYEIMSDHFKQVDGYAYYETAGELFQQVGLETAAKGYCQVNCWGSPKQILEKLRARWELLGGFELNVIASYGGMPIEDAEASLRLFSEQVLPELKRW